MLGGINISLVRRPACGAAAAGGTWTPLDLGASLKAWWDADDHGTARMVDDGAGLISSWTDKVSGLAVTATTTARPTWTSNAVNSAYAGLAFNGTTTVLLAAPPTGLPLTSVAGEIAVAVQQSSLPADTLPRCPVGYGSAAAQGRQVTRLVVSGANRASLSDASTALTDTVIDLSGPCVLMGNWAGTTEGGRVNGNVFTPATATIVTLATVGTRIRIGANSLGTATQFCNFPVRHVLVTLALALADRERLEAWLAWDMGAQSILPPGHTYKSARP